MAKTSRRQALDEIERASSRLSQIEREVLFLSAKERLGYDEIAARLGISSEEAKGHLADALYRLDRDSESGQRPWWRFW